MWEMLEAAVTTVGAGCSPGRRTHTTFYSTPAAAKIKGFDVPSACWLGWGQQVRPTGCNGVEVDEAGDNAPRCAVSSVRISVCFSAFCYVPCSFRVVVPWICHHPPLSVWVYWLEIRERDTRPTKRQVNRNHAKETP